jgi:AbrB family looped-hinge helix DNA binding protein
MATHIMGVTREGQVTIPIEVRRSLDLKEGDQMVVGQRGESVLLRRASSVAERTAGILAKYRLATPLSAEAERAAFERAVADEVVDDHRNDVADEGGLSSDSTPSGTRRPSLW